MAKVATIREQTSTRMIDVARRAQVSRAAVAQVLLGTGGSTVRVSDRTARRIRHAAEQLHYEPNLTARQLAGIKSHIIGVLIDSQAPPLQFVRLAEMERLASAAGYAFMIGQCHDDPKRIGWYIDQFNARGVDGVITFAHDYPQEIDRIAAAYRHGRNVVFVQQTGFVLDGMHTVRVDVADGVVQAIDHLVSRLRQRIALLLMDRAGQSTRLREQGYRNGLKRHKIKYAPGRVFRMQDQTLEQVQEAIAKLMEGDDAPDAIITPNDYCAAMAIRCLQKSKLRVPQDVAVVGYDNLSWGSIVTPALTTVDQNTAELSVATIRVLLALVEDKQPRPKEHVIVVKPQLIVREST